MPIDKQTARELATDIARALDDPSHDVWPELATRAERHPAVMQAQAAIGEAKRAATLAVVRDLEGLVAAEIEGRHGSEVYVRALVKVLGLIPQRIVAIDHGCAPSDLTARIVSKDANGIVTVHEMQCGEHIGIDGTTPRVPVASGWRYLGRARGHAFTFDVSTDGTRVDARNEDEPFVLANTRTVNELRDHVRLGSTWARNALALYDQWRTQVSR